MSPRLPVLTAAELIAILRAHGFERARQSGSHAILEHPDGRRAVVPVHKARDLPKGTLRQILRATGLTAEDPTRR